MYVKILARFAGGGLKRQWRFDRELKMWYDMGLHQPWGEVMSSRSISKKSTRNQQALEYLSVRGFYTSAYNELVQPERIFAVTHYFRRHYSTQPNPAGSENRK